jgi:hypothetical protein
LHSQRNGGFGTHFDPSRGAPRKRAIRPIEASKAAICNGSFAQIAVVPHPCCGELVDPTLAVVRVRPKGSGAPT